MSAIDKEIHKKEWNVISAFVKKHWKKEYGDFSNYKIKMINDLKGIVSSFEHIKNQLEEILTDLNPSLSQPQKTILLQLVGEVMAADNIMTIEESDLFAIFLKNLGVQNQ